METLTLTWVTPPRAYINPAKAAAAKAKRTNLLTLQLRCVLSATTGCAKGTGGVASCRARARRRRSMLHGESVRALTG